MGEQSRKSGNAVSAFPAPPVRNFIVSLRFAKNAGQLSLASKSQPRKNFIIFSIGKNIYLVNKSSDRFNSTSKNSQELMDSLAAVLLFAAVRCGFWAASCRISHTKVAEIANRLPVFSRYWEQWRPLVKMPQKTKHFVTTAQFRLEPGCQNTKYFRGKARHFLSWWLGNFQESP